MKITKLHVLSAVLLLSGSLADVLSAADSKEDGNWISLFNGKDLTGWTPVNDGVFAVTNGHVRILKGMGWLRTEKEYGDFVLEAEWQAFEPGYNSGFFVRAGVEGAPFPAVGSQINLKETALGSLMKGTNTVVASATPKMPVNQWVKFRMEVRGKRLTLDVDGKRAWEFNELEPSRGYIGIQAENKVIEFRNVRVQEIGATGQPASK